MKLPGLAAIARAVIALTAVLISSSTIAQPNYPDKPIRMLAGFPRCEAPRVRIAVSHFSISFTLSTDSQASYFFDLAVQADREVAKVPI